MHALHIVGTRPNFVKAAAVFSALQRRNAKQTFIHTGQHYDDAMSASFFEQLGLPRADFNLEVGSGNRAFQIAKVMARLEPTLSVKRPDVAIVYGDVNSTVAAALSCAKLSIPLAHVEAGMRCGDRTMPEEINRLVTDQLSTLLFTTCEDAGRNLQREGIAADKIRFVGNVMIDTLVRMSTKVPAELPIEIFKTLRAVNAASPG